MNDRDLFFKHYRQLSDINNFDLIVDSPALAGVKLPFALPDGTPVNLGAWMMACYQCFNYAFPTGSGVCLQLVQGVPNIKFPGMFTATTPSGARVTRFIPRFLSILKGMMATFPSHGNEMSFADAMAVILRRAPEIRAIPA